MDRKATASVAWWLWAQGPNQTTYRDLKMAARARFWCQSASRALPSRLAARLRLPVVETRCIKRSESDRQALLASGYLVEVRLGVTNLLSRISELETRLDQALDSSGTYWVARFTARSNLVVVTCRPQCVLALESLEVSYPTATSNTAPITIAPNRPLSRPKPHRSGIEAKGPGPEQLQTRVNR